MPAECFGSVTGLLLGAGLGIIAVISMASAIIFLRYFKYAIDSDPEIYYSFKDPNVYTGELLDSTCSAGIFSLFSALCAIGAIAVSGILKGNTTILLGIGGACCAFTLASIISEGMFYDYAIKDNYLSYSSSSLTTYRNISTAQRFIGSAFENGYKQAEINLVEKYPELKDKFDTWKTVKERFGEEYNDTYGETHIFTYNTLLQNLHYWQKWNKTIQIDYKSDGTMRGIFYNESDYEFNVIIASLNFNYTKQQPKPYRDVYCWNKTINSGLNCKVLDEDMTEDNYIIPEVTAFFNDPFALQQVILKTKNGKKIKYYDSFQISNGNYDVDYVVQAPVAYRLVKYDEIKDYDNNQSNPDFYKQIIFEKPTHYYRVNPKSYIKAEYKYLIKQNSIKSSKMLDSFYYCIEEPTSYRDTSAEITLPSGLKQKKCYTTKTKNMRYGTLSNYLDYQFRHEDVGRYPSFFLSYHRNYYIKEYIFGNKGDSVNAEFAIGAIILQILGILLYGIGKGYDFIGGGGGSD